MKQSCDQVFLGGGLRPCVVIPRLPPILLGTRKARNGRAELGERRAVLLPPVFLPCLPANCRHTGPVSSCCWDFLGTSVAGTRGPVPMEKL